MADGIVRCRPSRFSSKIEIPAYNKATGLLGHRDCIRYCEFQRREKASCSRLMPLCAKPAKSFDGFVVKLSVEDAQLNQMVKLILQTFHGLQKL
jgi:hypothetical protein